MRKILTKTIRFKSKILTFAFILFALGWISSCQSTASENDRLNVVVTTNIFSDLVANIGGDSIQLQALMGSGVDPHLYKASEGDVSKLVNADIVFYGGLHLEGKMVDIFEKMKSNKITVALGETLDKSELIESENFGGNYDPHIWFNVGLFKELSNQVTKVLSEADEKNADYYRVNNENYQKELDELDIYIRKKLEELPENQRVLITAHDAFSYLGEEYGIEVMGLQGISTTSEAGVRDVQRLRNFIIEHQIKAIFIENSVPRRNIEALQEAVKKEGHEVKIGGELFSDSLGNPGTDEGTYIGMFKHNINTIVEALK